MRDKFLLLRICLLVVLVAVGGCRSGDVALSREERELEAKVKRYGRVAPELLDKSLTADQRARMSLELSQIQWESLSDELASKAPAALRSGSAVSREDALAAQKAYLHGRGLLSKSMLAGGSARLTYHRQAIEQLSEGLEHDPNNAHLHTALAEAYFGIGKESAGAQHCQKALDFGGADFQAWQVLGSGYMKQGRQKDAALCFHKALNCDQYSDDNPQAAVLHMQLATSLNEQGYFLAAAQEYHNCRQLLLEQRGYGHTDIIISQLINNIHVTLLIEAQLYLRMGYIDRAVDLLWSGRESLSLQGDIIKPFALSLTLQPLSLQVRYNQVAALCRYLVATAEQPEESLSVFYQSCENMSRHDAYLAELQLWHKSADLWSLLPIPIENNWRGGSQELLNARLYAYGLALADKNTQARQVLEEHLKNVKSPAADEDVYLSYRDLARLYGKSGNWPDMLWAYSLYLESGRGDVAMTLAEITKSLAALQEWSGQFDKWSSDDRIVSSGMGCFLLGQLAGSRQDDTAAEQMYRCAMRNRPDFALARKELIELLLRHGRNDEVLSCISQAGLEDDVAMLYYAGQACRDMGRMDEASRYYKKLIELDADSPKAYMALAQVLYYQDEYNLAEELLLKVQSRWPGEGEVYGHLLALYARWSQQEKITEAFRLVAQNRARNMLVNWIDSSRRQSGSAAGDEPMSRITATLKKMSGQYPKSQVTGLLLCELYLATEQYDKAVAEIDRLSIELPDDTQVLTMSAEINEKYGNGTLAANQRLKLWQNDKNDMKLLAAALGSMRNAGKSTQALEILRNSDADVVIANPEAADALRAETMRLLMATRQYNNAVELLERWYGLALTEATGQGDNQVRQLLCRKLLSNFIWSLTEAGYYDRAVLQTKALYNQYRSDDTTMAIWLSRTLNVRMLFDLNLNMLTELLRQQGDDPALRLQWYRTMAAAGRQAEAAAETNLWLNRISGTKQYADVLLLFGMELGDYQKVVDFLHNEISARPQNNTPRLQLADVLIESGKYDEADSVLADMSVDEDIFANWLDLQISLDISRGQWQRAINRVEALANDKSSVYIWKLEVRILDLSDQAEKALDIQRKIVSYSPEDLDAGLQCSILLERTGRIAEAIEVLKGLLDKKPDDSGLKNNLGYLLIEAGQETELAYKLLTEGLEADPQSGPTLDSLGWFYYKEGKFALAMEYLLQAAAIMTEPDPEILEHLGDTAYRLDRRDQARLYWQWALDELGKRLGTQRYLQKDKDLLEKKLQQLVAGQAAEVAKINNKL